MIPLRDDVQSSIAPVVSWLVIALNAFGFMLEMGQGSAINQFIEQHGLIPADFLGHFGVGQIVNVFTSMFMHGGFAHIIGNMWFLFIFGDNVEDRMGHVGFLFFYLLTGICAAMAQVFLSGASNVPMIGASGAISGVLGAYFIFYPKATVLALVPLGGYSRMMHVPAGVFLGLWFVMQLVSQFSSALGVEDSETGGVAFLAHLGGFAAGMILAKIFDRGGGSASGAQLA
ncbi:MAG: rhomboid family intramembrane serine protease [Candidatus Melainabacteria bacterium]|nr:MAG: rhomboid family intramembrane serine protease [Candidatus Melainabacteria bacterium]